MPTTSEFIPIAPVTIRGSLGLAGTGVESYPGSTSHGDKVVPTTRTTQTATVVAVDLPGRRARTAEGHVVNFDYIWVRDLNVLFTAAPLVQS